MFKKLSNKIQKNNFEKYYDFEKYYSSIPNDLKETYHISDFRMFIPKRSNYINKNYGFDSVWICPSCKDFKSFQVKDIYRKEYEPTYVHMKCSKCNLQGVYTELSNKFITIWRDEEK